MDRHEDLRPTAAAADPLRPSLLVVALVVVAALTLTPHGTGWTWGPPLEELRWYAAGLGSGATVVQLLGNLLLLTVPAALAVTAWPAAGRLLRLGSMAIGAAATIEVLQWALPLGRVVSPLDALLNAVGAIAAGLLVRYLRPPSSGTGPAAPALRRDAPRRCAPRPAAARPGRSPAPSPG